MDKIIGLGYALLGVHMKPEREELLAEMHLVKGGMNCIEEGKLLKFKHIVETTKCRKVSGGLVGVTMRSLARLGAAVGFIGKVGNDEDGIFYEKSIKKTGVEPFLPVDAEASTGFSATIVMPDGSCAWAYYLGAAGQLQAEDLGMEMFRGYAYLYIEGFLLQNHGMILRAIELAKEAGLQVCLDMGICQVAAEEREFFLSLINKYVDIVFVGKQEICTLMGQDFDAAFAALGRICSVVVARQGTSGWQIRKGTEEMHVMPQKVKKVLDITGESNYFAAGFLYGLTSGYALEKCGYMGAAMAAEVAQVAGTELSPAAWKRLMACVETLAGNVEVSRGL